MFPRLSVFSTLTAALGVVIYLAAPAPAAEPDRAAQAYAAGDYQAAAEEWRRRAETGDRTAQFNLALLYDNPASGLFDTARAATWYKQAASHGLAAAQYNLALAQQTGRGVPKDLSQALFWLLIAAGSEDAEVASRAGSAAGVLNLLLDEDTREQTIARAQEWRATPEPAITPRAQEAAGEKPYMSLPEGDARKIQQRLKSLGYDPGPVDGIAGPATQKAIAAYFADRGGEWRHAPLSHRLLEILH